jgi:5S rRNA maturation endonuclease (ribonuclease M5)
VINKKNGHSKRRKDTIKCECGEEILILPDVRATGESIEVHVALHLKGVKGPECSTLEAERLRNALIVQVLEIAGESE